MLPKSLISVVTLVLLSIAERSYQQDPDLFQGDMILSESQQKEIKRTPKVSGLTIKKWPKPYSIPYVISSDFSDSQKKRIMAGINEFNAKNSKKCVQLKQRKRHTNYIQFVKEGTSCSSALGFLENGVQNITLPEEHGCLKLGNVLHQIMHAVGLEHEYAWINRDRYIRIVWENVKEECKHWMKLIPGSHNFITKKLTKKLGYDYNSVMYYNSSRICSKNGGYTILANDKDVETKIGGNKLTEQDVQKVTRFYGCSQNDVRHTSTTRKPFKGQKKVPNRKGY